MIQMLRYPDFFESGYKFKWDKDVSHYLDKVADKDEAGKMRGLCHRIVRAMVDIYRLKSKDELDCTDSRNIDLIRGATAERRIPLTYRSLRGCSGSLRRSWSGLITVCRCVT
jgi:glucosamine-6-phosphate deaminase